jgi:hypothetical protein
MEALSCFGFLSLFLLWCALAILWLNSLLSKASGGGRRRSCLALPLLPPLLLFSSFSFASSSLSGYKLTATPCLSSPSAVCSYIGQTYSSSSDECIDSSGGADGLPGGCSVTCTLPPGTVDTSPNSPASGGSFCNSSTDCEESVFMIMANGSEVFSSNGSACFPSSATVSSAGPTSCPSGYSFAGSACACVNSSGDSVPANGASSDPSCNGGSPTAPVLSPVSPVTSNGVTSCPPGSASSTSGSSVSCYQIVVPPLVNPQSTPSGSQPGGGGGGSSFHLVAPTKSSNGQLVCPPGSSSISGANGSGLMCVVSGSGGGGSGTAPTSSGTSGTSSAASYPTSLSMPALPGASVGSVSLGSIPAAVEVSGESCPAPVTFVVMGHTFSITFSYACGLAAKVRPVVVGVFSLASLLLLVK